MTEPALVMAPGNRLAELWMRTSWRAVVYVACCVLAGGLSGLLWAAVTRPPSYLLREDLSATMSELNLADIISADANFAFITGALGLAIGVAGWLVLHKRGWVVTALPVIAAFAASLMAWRLGVIVGTSGFDERLATASAGDLVQVDLQLRALSALIVGPFMAITPIMLLSAFWPEPRHEHPEGDPLPTH